MGLFDVFKRGGQATVTLPTTYRGRPIEMVDVNSMGVPELWSRQPHLRTVVSFLARNIAQLGLHVYERDGDDSRTRDRTSPLAMALSDPGDRRTAYDLIFGLVGDMALYDRAYWVLLMDGDGKHRLRRLPPEWVEPFSSTPFTVDYYKVRYNGVTLEIPADKVLDFTGYAPASATAGSATIEALRETLREQIESTKYRLQTWSRGGRVSAVLERPADAPGWSDAAREAFREDWYSKYTGNGTKAGGTPILEDGMQLKRIDFSAREQEYVEAVKLSLATVASAFHVNPTMIGLLDNANYANVREFRRMLYGDTLGPLLTQIESRVNAFLIPMLGMDPARFYCEFNIAEKLQGSFEEQTAAMQTSVGRPWMTADEARAKLNMTALGGDAAQLVTPLNVLVGGQASPTDSGSQNTEPKGVRTMVDALTKWFTEQDRAEAERANRAKASVTDPMREQVERVLAAFFDRQGKSVLSTIGSGGDWWDGDRWDRELADDLTKVGHTIATILGKSEAERLGYADTYDPDLTVAFIKTVMARKAASINATTKAQIEDETGDPDGDPALVFDKAKGSRAAGVAVGVGTFLASFGTGEAARQIAREHGGEPTKTWNTGSNPRKSHARMNGETVPIDEPFSNGCMWPADGPDVDEVAGCNCSVTINF